jgi:hypothetical protein
LDMFFRLRYRVTTSSRHKSATLVLGLPIAVMASFQITLL